MSTNRKKLATALGQLEGHLQWLKEEGVRSIAGYVLDKSGRRWIVVFFINHANAGAAQPAQDALLQWVYERGGT